MRPIVMISSWPPRLCGIATFAEEAVEFIRKAEPERKVYIISHTDGEGEFVKPIIDMSHKDWYLPVVDAIRELKPEVVHIQHEYGLYEYKDKNGEGDKNRGLLEMLDMLSDYPVVIEPHTIHGRMKACEEEFVKSICQKCSIVFFKCHYQKWRLEWTFANYGWDIPTNIMIVPHGARPDYRWAIDQVDDLKRELGLDDFIGKHIIGLIGWIQSNKRWDILTSIWQEIHYEILEQTGEDWFLFAAGEMRDPNHKPDFEKYVGSVKLLEINGIAKFFQFIPRGEMYYKVMAICDFIVLPSLDETQSGTLARVIALNKPYVTTAPMEGLTEQTVESEGGLLFSSKETLKKNVLGIAADENLRITMGNNLYKYLNEVVSWEIIARQYLDAYRLAARKVLKKRRIYIRPEFY